MDRQRAGKLPRMQISFIDVVCMPVYQVMHRCMNFVHTVAFYNCRYRYCHFQFVAVAFYCIYMYVYELCTQLRLTTVFKE